MKKNNLPTLIYKKNEKKMKKSVFILLLFVGNALLAQVPHPMDTIVGREPTYYYQLWFDSADFLHPYTCSKELSGSHGAEVAKYNYTDSTLKVVGIAACVYTESPGYSYPWQPQCADTSLDNWYENFILYKPTDTGLVMLATQRFSVLDTARRMKLYSNIPPPWPNRDTVLVRYPPVYEVYFDDTIAVTDSFYVSATNYNGVVNPETRTYPGRRSGPGAYRHWAMYPKPCYEQHIMWKDYEAPNNQWMYFFEDVVYLIFPIIDTTQPRCWRPLEFNVQRQDADGVYLAWEGGENNRAWEVAYGRADDDPEGYATLATARPRYTLTGLDGGVEYAVRVRSICFDNAMYSSWTDTLRFTREGGPVSVVTPDEDGDGIRLMPNPSSGNVVVESDCGIERVEVYDAKGERVAELTGTGRGTTADFDVSAWAKGSYVVLVHTPTGTASKRLVVN